MSRILVVENHERTLRVLQSTLAPLGYEMLAVEDVERLRLELRDQVPDLILVSADVAGGSGLDIVHDAASETPEPVPILAWSAVHPPDRLKELVPVELKIGGLLSAPLDPGELVRLTTMLVPPPDPAQAFAFIADLASDVEGAGAQRPEPDGIYDLARIRAAPLLAAIDHHDWSGALELHLSGTETTSLWFEMGQLVFARTAQGRDLVRTAVEEGRVRSTVVPDVPIHNLEEEAGLLMALRAIGMHERAGLEQRAAVRMLAQVLLARRGRAVARPDERPEDEFSNPFPVIPVVLEALRSVLKEDRGLEAHPDSVVVVRLPPLDALASWALSPPQRRVIDHLAGARNREITLEQLARVVNEDDPDAGEELDGTLALLQELGYVHFCGRPFSRATTERLDEFVETLHRFSRSDHFDVLGVKASADGKAIRRALRDRSRAYHPDTTFGDHPRVMETSNAIYARIQEAWGVLRNEDSRAAYAAQRKLPAKQGSHERAKVAVAQGRGFLKSRRYEDARQALRDARLEDPDHMGARVLHAWATYLCDPEHPRPATNELKRLINEDRKNAEAWYYLGRITALQDDPTQARRYFAQAVEADPNHADAGRELARLDRRGGAGSGAGDRKVKRGGLLSRFRRGD